MHINHGHPWSPPILECPRRLLYLANVVALLDYRDAVIDAAVNLEDPSTGLIGNQFGGDMLESDVPASLAKQACPDLGEPTATRAPGPGEQRVALISTAGLIQRGDRPFELGASGYRVIDSRSNADVLMTHISTNFDRSGFLQDREVVFPLKALGQMADRGEIGSVARFHFSFMGATDPTLMKPAAVTVAKSMLGEGANVAVLIPV